MLGSGRHTVSAGCGACDGGLCPLVLQHRIRLDRRRQDNLAGVASHDLDPAAAHTAAPHPHLGNVCSWDAGPADGSDDDEAVTLEHNPCAQLTHDPDDVGRGQGHRE